MAIIEYKRHDHLGAEFGMVICDTCRSTVTGSKVIFEYHNGYGEKAKSATPEQKNQLDIVAKTHDANHNVRIIVGHKESTRNPQTGNSLTIYEYKAPWTTRG